MTVNNTRPMRATEWGLLILLSVVWGGSFFFNAVAVAALPPLTVVFARVFLAALILAAVLRAKGIPMPKSPQIWRAFFIMGLLNNVIPFTLIVWGQIHIASGVASILNATTPLFGVLLAHVATKDEKMNTGRIIGVVLGLIGVTVLTGTTGFTGPDTHLLAILAILAGAFSYALAGVFGRRFRALGVPPLATATGQVSTAAVMMLPLMLWVDHPWTLPLPSLPVILSLLGIASISTAFAYALYFRVLATAGATNLLLVTFLIPVSAILLGVAVLGESLLPEHRIGMVLIGAGLVAIDGRFWRWLRSTKTAAP